MRTAHFLLVFFTFLGLSATAQIQVQPAAPPYSAFPETALCLWDAVGVRSTPGRDSRPFGTVYFGEEVEVLGDTAFVPRENRVYIKIRSKKGIEGWVHKYLFAANGSMVVLLKDADIYKSPGSIATITNVAFKSGSLAAMTDFQDNWVELIGRKRQAVGWIRRDEANGELLSIADRDIQVASLMAVAEEKDDLRERLDALEKIRQIPNFNESPISTMVLERIQRDLSDLTSQQAQQANAYNGGNAAPAQPQYDYVEALPEGSNTRQATIPVANPSVPGSQSSMNREMVIDSNTGIRYTKVTERGPIYEVRGPKDAKSIYFGYHKTLPKGTRVMLNVPDNPGFVEIEIINKLSADRPQIIGLSKECIQSVYGNTPPAEAQLVYFIKE
ncbi:MAG: SH3 domain-containing protein [Bacteroidota bacterium]